MTTFKYRRVLVKLSGESLCQPGGFGLDGDAIAAAADRILAISQAGTQVALVVGGGNFLRGAAFSANSPIRRTTADYMGMLATVMNACALQETLERKGQPTRVLSAIKVEAICEPFIRRNALRHLDSGRVVILAGGTGNPFFSTDTCGALRASELEADLMIKATKVDGVYTADPMTHPEAVLIDRMTYQQVLEKNLKVMDSAAISLCRDNRIPIVVLNIFHDGSLQRALQGEPVGTWIGD